MNYRFMVQSHVVVDELFERCELLAVGKIAREKQESYLLKAQSLLGKYG